MKNIILIDYDISINRILSRFSTIFSKRNGIFSESQRISLKFPSANIYFYHPDKNYEYLAAQVDGFLPYRGKFDESMVEKYISGDDSSLRECFDYIIDSRACSPVDVIDDLPNRIIEDVPVILSGERFVNYSKPTGGVYIVGSANDIHVHETVKINPGTIFDTSNGPIVIDEYAKVGQFSYLEGPLYVGKNAHIDNARLIGGTVIGTQCRIGGEVEASIINDFSNKHHEGFIGHSVLGKWVNIGALATTSDLKNNYGKIKLLVPSSLIPSPNIELQYIETNLIKFGSIIGDCSKIAIGMRLNTGTVIDAGCNVFGNAVDKYVPLLSWGSHENKYDINRFVSDTQKIFMRRNEVMSSAFVDLAKLYVNN